MGRLIFAEHNGTSEIQRHLLTEPGTASGKACWLRMLCLGTLLGDRAHPTAIRKFWKNKLPQVWHAMIPDSEYEANQDGYQRRLDQVFQETIHMQFKDNNARGEDAKFWRRVFYDFRKLHHFVYFNDLPEAFLELACMPGLHSSSLLHFLKSGWLPDGHGHSHGRWVGVLGQSMNEPLLLILRELRRLDVIDSRFDPVCFYMNSAARTAAAHLGWITSNSAGKYSLGSLIEQSQECFSRMRLTAPELVGFFDIPLQWYALRKQL
jgi:hypothetical protein